MAPEEEEIDWLQLYQQMQKEQEDIESNNRYEQEIAVKREQEDIKSNRNRKGL